MLDNQEEMMTMKNRLENILRQGIELYLDGRPASPEGIADRFVKEEAVYMPDFVIDENGALTQIRYDKVMEKQPFK